MQTWFIWARTMYLVTVKHLQLKQWERHVERRAHVVNANLSSLKEPLTNELPGVHLIDICSENIPSHFPPALLIVYTVTMGKKIIRKDKIFLSAFSSNPIYKQRPLKFVHDVPRVANLPCALRRASQFILSLKSPVVVLSENSVFLHLLHKSNTIIPLESADVSSFSLFRQAWAY